MIRFHRPVLAASLVACLVPIQAFSASVRYRNDRWGFCFKYPAGWLPYEGVDKAGVRLTRGGGAISVGALPNHESDSGEPMTLDELTSGDLQDFGVAMTPAPKDVKVISRRKTTFLDLPAMRTEVTYTQGGAAKVEETIYVIKDNAVYDFTVRCPVQNRACPRMLSATYLQDLCGGAPRGRPLLGDQLDGTAHGPAHHAWHWPVPARTIRSRFMYTSSGRDARPSFGSIRCDWQAVTGSLPSSSSEWSGWYKSMQRR
jgi:hypothetical protein